ncbi:nitroreductase family protein [Microbacterium album]|uniref:Nitroreductase domain-containing protein n=1 Tax=Microbacterium album TaxID=2053191 RepID=A0A917MLA3_9MICO|nr:nitroreductase family protein [Microbacterium album]GGH41193.1 hypothetical protein GCM10010921_13610 [Microbacterium album]
MVKLEHSPASIAQRAVGAAKRRAKRMLAGSPFAREKRAVSHGIRRYRNEIGGGSDLYLLRRNTHMLEKGLTMRPRRDTFAVDYIEQTIASFDALLRSGGLAQDAMEFQWMRAVLDEYFEATAASRNPVIARARERFAALHCGETTSETGPHVHQLMGHVTIDDLTSLAHGRRSVRWFTSEPVPLEAVDRAITVAAEAPTACNRQPYRFEIFDDPGSVAKVAAIPMGTKGFAGQIPGIIVVIGDLSAFFDERDRHLIYVDASLATMGLILGLEAQGIASCSINWPDMPDRESRMRDLLGLAPWERVVLLVAYGYADPQGLVPFSAKRRLELIRSHRTL